MMPPRPASSAALTARTALLGVAAFTLVRLLLAPTIELMPQEAYYFFYAEYPALSYFDHPPVLAWCLWLMSQLTGKTVFTLRATSFLLTLLTLWTFWRLARRFVPADRAPQGLLLFASTGLLTSLALVSTPDVPLLLFWSLALEQLARALFDERRSAWLWAGLSMGLAFDSKYTAVFLQAGLLCFLVLSREHRRWLRTPWPWLCVLLAHVAALPVYVWNAQHGFASLLFQSSERASSAGGGGLRPQFLLALIATQAGLLIPPLLGALALRAAGGLRRPRALLQGTPQGLFLACFCLPLLLLFTGLSLFTLVKPNWLLPAYVSGVLWVAQVASARLVRWNVGLSALLHVLAAVQLVLYPVPIRSDDTWVGWEQLAREVDARWKEHPEAFVFAADDYKTTAELSFYLDRTIHGRNVLGLRGLQYDYVGRDLQALRGKDALYLDSQPRHAGDTLPPAEAPPPALVEHFGRVTEQAPILLQHRGRTVRAFRVWWAEDYRGP